MQGSIEERIRAKGRDANGRMRSNLKVYDVRYRYVDPISGQSRQRRKRGFLRRADAEAFLLKINAEQADGIYLVPKPLLVKEYLQEWLDSYAKLHVRESTFEGYHRIVTRHLIPHLGGIDIKKLSPLHIDKFYGYLMKEGRVDGRGGLSARSILYTHRVLNEALEHAVRKSLIARNPLKSITNLPKPKRYQAPTYSVEELRELLSITRDSAYELPIALAGICGLRKGECLGLALDDVDFDRQIIHVRHQLIEVHLNLVVTAPKSNESIRDIGAPAEVFEIIRRRIQAINRHKEMLQAEYHDSNLLVCCNDGKPFRPRNFTNNFKAILAKNGMRPIRFHDLRHTCASLMLKTGIALKTASEILGHSTISITADLYTHVQENIKLDAARQMGALVFGTSAGLTTQGT